LTAVTGGSDTTPTRIGCIGCGYIGRQHMANVARSPHFVPHAYADTVPTSSERFLEDFGGSYATDNWQRVVEDPSVDALLVCTPDATHREIALAAAQMGKHVLMEKPVALTSADCAEIRTAFQDTGLAFVVDMKFRYSRTFQAAMTLMPRPQLVAIQAMMNPLASSSWRLNPDLGGGVLFDLGTHALDAFDCFFGAGPISVYASSPPGGIHRQRSFVSAQLEYSEGRASLLVGDLTIPAPASKWYLQAFDGDRAITISNHWRDLVVSTQGEPPDQVLKDSDDVHLSGALSRVLGAFAEAIESPREDHLLSAGRTATALDLTQRSLSSGQPQRLDDIATSPPARTSRATWA
jgi:predicted dehydrogenase